MKLTRLVTAAATALAAVGMLGATVVPAHAADDLNRKGYLKFQAGIAQQIDRYWAGVLPAYGVRYSSPRLKVVPAGKVVRACGGLAGDPKDNGNASGAFYCRPQHTVYLSAGWMYRDIYRQFGDFGAAVVVAHEWGHHVQTLAGIVPRVIKVHELQADCLAGIWSRNALVSGQMGWPDMMESVFVMYDSGDYAYGHPDHHGTPKERVNAFAKGARKGDPARC